MDIMSLSMPVDLLTLSATTSAQRPDERTVDRAWRKMVDAANLNPPGFIQFNEDSAEGIRRFSAYKESVGGDQTYPREGEYKNKGGGGRSVEGYKSGISWDGNVQGLQAVGGGNQIFEGDDSKYMITGGSDRTLGYQTASLGGTRYQTGVIYPNSPYTSRNVPIAGHYSPTLTHQRKPLSFSNPLYRAGGSNLNIGGGGLPPTASHNISGSHVNVTGLQRVDGKSYDAQNVVKAWEGDQVIDRRRAGSETQTNSRQGIASKANNVIGRSGSEAQANYSYSGSGTQAPSSDGENILRQRLEHPPTNGLMKQSNINSVGVSQDIRYTGTVQNNAASDSLGNNNVAHHRPKSGIVQRSAMNNPRNNTTAFNPLQSRLNPNYMSNSSETLSATGGEREGPGYSGQAPGGAADWHGLRFTSPGMSRSTPRVDHADGQSFISV